MFQKFLVAILAAAVACAAFLGASMATASPGDPDLPSWVPAAALAKTSVSQHDQIAINNLIPSQEAGRLGISPGSFNNARVLTDTQLGSLYIIPGRSGLCLALSSRAVSCTSIGSTKSSGKVLAALLVANDSGQLVGGGLLDRDNRSVAIDRKDGSRVSATDTPGGFMVGSGAGLHTGDAVRVEAN